MFIQITGSESDRLSRLTKLDKKSKSYIKGKLLLRQPKVSEIIICGTDLRLTGLDKKTISRVFTTNRHSIILTRSDINTIVHEA